MKTIILKRTITLSVVFFSIFFVTSCTSIKKHAKSKKLARLVEKSSVFSSEFSGIALFDISNQKYEYQYQANKHYVPASNAKVLSFFAGISLLGDSIPALRYVIHGDSLFFTGTGDPSFLDPDFPYNHTLEFLASRKEKLFYIRTAYSDPMFGLNWAWDDYNENYSPERSGMPIYANIVRFSFTGKNNVFSISPDFFSASIITEPQKKWNYDLIQRDIYGNTFHYFPRADTVKGYQEVPFRMSDELVVQLLSDTLKKKVYLANFSFPYKESKLLKGIPTDSLLKKMMIVSDNFIAEQVLVMASLKFSDTLRTSPTRIFVVDSLLKGKPDLIKWVDGSGLSRHNLFTPNTTVFVLNKLYSQIPEKRLFNMLSIGGVRGTLRNWFKAETPYVFAKTGTLTGVFCLSGYLISKSGKRFIFSVMNNNYLGRANDYKKEIQKILEFVRDSY